MNRTTIQTIWGICIVLPLLLSDPSCITAEQTAHNADYNKPLLVKCEPLLPIKQTFCPPAVKNCSIKNDSKSIHHLVNYHTSCWSAKFSSTHRDGEQIKEKFNKYSEPDYWGWLLLSSGLCPAGLRIKERNYVSLAHMQLELKFLNYFSLEVHICNVYGFYFLRLESFNFQDLIANSPL